MALSTITFVKGNGGLAIPQPGEDHVSGLIFYAAAKPSGFTAEPHIKQVTSVVDAEAKGIIAGSNLVGVMHYQISEFFRLNKGAELHVLIADAAPTTFAEIKTLQNYCDGRLRQVGIYGGDLDFATSQVTAIQSILEDMEDEYQPLSVIYAPNIADTADYTTLPTLRALTGKKVSVLIGADGGAEGAVGKGLFDALDYSVAALGACLGAVSLANVNESIGWVAKFQVASAELDVPMLANGQSMKTVGLAGAGSLNDKGYVFLIKEQGVGGTYFNFGNTAVVATDDYATIEANRTIDKAIRGMNASLIPEKNRPMYVDPSTGKLAYDTIKYLESVVAVNLDAMKRNGELSGYEIIINPEQSILSTKQLDIEVNLVPVGVLKTIKVNVGYKLKLS